MAKYFSGRNNREKSRARCPPRFLLFFPYPQKSDFIRYAQRANSKETGLSNFSLLHTPGTRLRESPVEEEKKRVYIPYVNR